MTAGKRVPPARKLEIVRMRRSGYTIKSIAYRFDLCTNTINRIIKENKEGVVGN